VIGHDTINPIGSFKVAVTVNMAGNIGWREFTHFGISPHQVGATQNHLIQNLLFG
jgi:hypothetical protein